MDPERWALIGRLFHEALERPGSERAGFLASECGTDAELCAEIERLLALDATGDELLAGLAPPKPDATWTDPLIGRQLGAYRLVARIAAGGMGVVYRAVRADGLYDREVAVKLVRGEVPGEQALRRFDLERRTLASLDHPHIARLYDGGMTPEGTPYLVMEFVDGRPIDVWCREKRLAVAGRLALFTSVCRAVHFAHQNLVVHGDLKPPNVLVDAGGTAKLLDFGIARLLEGSEERTAVERTLTIGRFLTPEYASPEQWRGEPLTTAADVYSLGVVLHVLLTGSKPFRCVDMSPAEWERTLTEEEPTRPSARIQGRGHRQPPAESGEPSGEAFAASCGTTPARLARSLRGDLDRIVLMALRKDPARRYESAQALAEDVERHLTGRPVQAREDSFAYRSWSFVRRNRLAVAAGAVVLAAPSAGLFFSLRAEQRARRDAAHARIEAESFRRVAELHLEALLQAEGHDPSQRPAALRATVLAQADHVRRLFSAERHLQANLLDALGLFCLRTGAGPADAEALLQEALALRELEFGPDSIEVALSLRSLAELERQRDSPERAAGHLGRALELPRSSSGVHTDVAQAASELGRTWMELGRSDEADELFEEALALRRAQFGPRALPVAESLEDLAGLLLRRGEVETAASRVEEALAIRRQALGEDDPETARTRALLAAVRKGHAP